jgi:hypothetical protein
MRAARVRGNACTRARVHFLWVRGKWHDKWMARARCMNEAWVCMEAVHGAEEHLEHLECRRTPGM